jgi:ribosome modulation factor
MSKVNKIAFSMGWGAAARGESADNNPYKYGAAASWWLAGFEMCRDNKAFPAWAL